MNPEQHDSHDFWKGLLIGVIVGVVLWSLILWIVGTVFL